MAAVLLHGSVHANPVAMETQEAPDENDPAPAAEHQGSWGWSHAQRDQGARGSGWASEDVFFQNRRFSIILISDEEKVSGSEPG